MRPLPYISSSIGSGIPERKRAETLSEPKTFNEFKEIMFPGHIKAIALVNSLQLRQYENT